MYRLRFILACVPLLPMLAAAATATAAPPGLPNDTPVRVKSSGLGGAWLEGKIGTSPAGCTMIHLRSKTASGYDSVSLAGADALQRANGGAWADVAVKPLRAGEPKACRDGDND
jgi:hypothetical protein